MVGGNVKYVVFLTLLLIAAPAQFHTCDAFKVEPYQSGVPVPRLYEPASAPAMLPVLPGEGIRHWKDMPTGRSGRHTTFTLEIEVSRSEHTLKLIGSTFVGMRDVLYECRVGLGSSDFPTPVGLYYVTRIYDEAPWWIPPPSPWAWGESPSRSVYAGTMAPLLQKSFVILKKQQEDTEDMIEGPVTLDDSGYRFHGTNAPRSIGRNQSHGCVRMLPKDANQVATLIKEYVGTGESSRSANGKFVVLRSPVRLNLVR
ncbi:MAG: L,D-transpeptidase [Pseudomonadota bacterium]